MHGSNGPDIPPGQLMLMVGPTHAVFGFGTRVYDYTVYDVPAVKIRPDVRAVHLQGHFALVWGHCGSCGGTHWLIEQRREVRVDHDTKMVYLDPVDDKGDHSQEYRKTTPKPEPEKQT